jgi:hypothetical protein
MRGYTLTFIIIEYRALDANPAMIKHRELLATYNNNSNSNATNSESSNIESYSCQVWVGKDSSHKDKEEI